MLLKGLETKQRNNYCNCTGLLIRPSAKIAMASVRLVRYNVM